MAQTVCIILDATESAWLNAIASDRSRPLKHILRVRIVLLSAERLSVQEVARRAGVSRPAVLRWQQRYGEEGSYAAHKHPKVRAWLSRHPHWVVHFTPTSARPGSTRSKASSRP